MKFRLSSKFKKVAVIGIILLIVIPTVLCSVSYTVYAVTNGKFGATPSELVNDLISLVTGSNSSNESAGNVDEPNGDSVPQDVSMTITPTAKPVPALDNSVDGAKSGLYEGKSQEEIRKELKDKVKLFTANLTSAAIFKSGEIGSEGVWVVENLPQNEFAIQVYVYNYKNELIAKTAPIKPNGHIEKITLLKDLPKGVTKVYAYLNNYDLQSNEPVGQALFQNLNFVVN